MIDSFQFESCGAMLEGRLSFPPNAREITAIVILLTGDSPSGLKGKTWPAMIEALNEKGIPGYSCRYFPAPGPVPRLQFVIIDRKEVIFASSAYPCLCAMTQADLAAIFCSYFEAIWSSATPLKEATQRFESEIRKVLESPVVSHPQPVSSDVRGSKAKRK